MAKTAKHRHPKELFILAFCSLTLRYAFWGVGNLLVLYLIKSYHFSEVKSTHIYGLFSGISAFLPLVGGIVADRWNYRQPLILGYIATALGCVLISLHQIALLYSGLVFLALGYGLFVPSIFTILGFAYHDKHDLRESGFSIYYASMNIGVFLAMVSIGYIAETLGWNIAFLIAGIVQIFGLIGLAYYFKKYYKDFHPTKKVRQKPTALKLKKFEIDRLIVILVLSLVSLFFWTAYTQGWSSMSIFALNYVNKNIFGFQVPTAWYLSFESLFLIILVWPLTKFYRYLQKKKKDPSPSVKSSISLIMMGICFAVLMFASFSIPDGAKSASLSPYSMIIPYFFMAISELLIAPIGLSLITRLAPHGLTGMLVGFWYVISGAAYYIGGILAGLITKFHKISNFFNIFVLMAIIPAVLLLLFAKKLNKMRHMDKF